MLFACIFGAVRYRPSSVDAVSLKPPNEAGLAPEYIQRRAEFGRLSLVF